VAQQELRDVKTVPEKKRLVHSHQAGLTDGSAGLNQRKLLRSIAHFEQHQACADSAAAYEKDLMAHPRQLGNLSG